MNTPTTLPEVIAYLTAKFTAGTNLSRVGESRPEHEGAATTGSDNPDVASRAGEADQQPRNPSWDCVQPAQNPLSQTQILHLLELGLANPRLDK